MTAPPKLDPLPSPTKPGDHPEFFRFPAPAGRSRESTIRIDADAHFWQGGELVLHAGVAAAFASWIARHPDDGRYILTNGYDWTYFTVEDAPYAVRALVFGARSVEIVLSDGSTEDFDPRTVVVGERDALYCLVKGGTFEARFSRSAQTALGPVLVEGPDGAPVLEIGGVRWQVGVRSAARPRP